MPLDDSNTAVFSAILSRAAEALARERFADDMAWARFLADGQQWCRVTDEGIQIIPIEQIYEAPSEP